MAYVPPLKLPIAPNATVADPFTWFAVPEAEIVESLLTTELWQLAHAKLLPMTAALFTCCVCFPVAIALPAA